MTIVSQLHKLVDLAKEKSSDRRRDLMREITDVFLDAPPEHGAVEHSHFDDVLSRLASQTAQDAREELARRFADAPLAPRGLILQLARDAVEVAAPILQRSRVLDEADLVALASDASQAHLRMISGRESVPETVSAAIVRRGDDDTVAALVGNEGARLSRQTYETVVERAAKSPALHAPLVERGETPPDLLHDLMMVVETRLRDRILERFDAIDPEKLEEALAASHTRLEARSREDQEMEEARRYVQTMQVRRQLDGTLLARLLREKETAKFIAALSAFTGFDVATVKTAVEHESIDPLCLVCKAAGMDRTLFVTLCVLRGHGLGESMRDAREYGEIYDVLPETEAQRAMRFLKLRRNAAAA